MLTTTDITIAPVDASTAPVAVAFASKVFSQREPMARAIGVLELEIRPVVEFFVQQAMDAKLAFLATAPSGVPVSFAFGNCLSHDEPDATLSKKVVSIFTFLEALTNLYVRDPRWLTKKTALFVMAGTSTFYLSDAERASLTSSLKTLTSTIVAKQIAAARALAYETMITQATSSASQNLVWAEGFQRIARQAYGTYECPILGGKPYTALCDEHCDLAVKEF